MATGQMYGVLVHDLQNSSLSPKSAARLEYAVLGEISGGDAVKSGKFSSRLKAGAAKSHA